MGEIISFPTERVKARSKPERSEVIEWPIRPFVNRTLEYTVSEGMVSFQNLAELWAPELSSNY